MREVFNLFSFDSVLQVKRSRYFTDYQFRRPTTSSGLKFRLYKVVLNTKKNIFLKVIHYYEKEVHHEKSLVF